MIIFKVNRLKKKLLIETCTWVSKSVYICHKNNTMKKKKKNKKKKKKQKKKLEQFYTCLFYTCLIIIIQKYIEWVFLHHKYITFLQYKYM